MSVRTVRPLSWSQPPLGMGRTVAALLSAGTDPSMEDREGRTALRWAQRRGHEDVAERLHGMDRSNWGK